MSVQVVLQLDIPAKTDICDHLLEIRECVISYRPVRKYSMFLLDIIIFLTDVDRDTVIEYYDLTIMMGR